MQRIGLTLALLVGVVALIAAVATADEEIAALDDCEPVSFTAVLGSGACTIRGDVTFSEFRSVLPFGHPAWRNEPAYLKVEPGETVTVTNEGGEPHTFTEVVAFGNGYVPPLNTPTGSTTAVPECAGGPSVNATVAHTFLKSGASLEVSGLNLGTHFFQCCIHPWMRAAIKVKADQ